MNGFLAQWYWQAGLCLTVFWMFLAFVHRFFINTQSASFWLRFGHGLTVLALLLPIPARFVTAPPVFKHTPQIWSEIKNWNGVTNAARDLDGLAGNSIDALNRHSTDIPLANLVFAVWLLGVTIGLGRFSLSIMKLRRAISTMPLIKKCGRLHLCLSETDLVAFSVRIGGKAFVVIPQNVLRAPHDFKMALAHEFQHHRQNDTVWIYLYELLKILFFWNPALFFLSRWIARNQEFSCDENLIGRQTVSTGEYGASLMRAAQIAITGVRTEYVGTAGFVLMTSGQFLKRRIEMIMDSDKRSSAGLPGKRTTATLFVISALILSAGVALALQSSGDGVIGGHTLTLAQAQALAARSGSDIPVSVNDLVLTQLNYFVGTEKGRVYVQNALARMPQYHSMIVEKARRYGAPLDLLAVPVAESGYRNYDWNISAGLWGFVKQTARHYGLAVNNATDERLDEEKETVAAMRYFTDLKSMFQDWRLALLGYNLGEKEVQRTMDELNTSDPWVVERAHPNGEHYLAKVTALILIMKNPSVMN